VFFDNPSFESRAFHAVTDGEGYYGVADLPPASRPSRLCSRRTKFASGRV